MRFLASYRGGLLVVSHDLMLLDAAITRILHLDDGGLVQYRGSYSQYREARRRDEVRQARVAERQQAEIARLAGLADAMRHQTTKRARIAKTLDSRVERLRSAAVAAPARHRKVRFRFPEPPHSGNVVLTAHGLAKSYGGPPVFEEVGFTLGRGERLQVDLLVASATPGPPRPGLTVPAPVTVPAMKPVPTRVPPALLVRVAVSV